MNATTVYQAKKIITMDDSKPTATHVAVEGDKVVAVGDQQLLDSMPGATLDQRFADKIIMPGFVEAHSHATEGCMWQYPYIGFFDRTSPDGKLWAGMKSKDAIVNLLREHVAGPEVDRVIAWGYDPIYFADESPLTRKELDKISTTVPILVFHASFHILVANSALLNNANLLESSKISGVVRDEKGQLTGELQGFAARNLALATIGWNRYIEMAKDVSLWNFANSAKRAGVTTATDLGNAIIDDAVDSLLAVTQHQEFPLRIVVALQGTALSAKDGCARINEIKKLNTDKVRFGILKLTLDGSIQGFTARILEPGYHNGHENGLWYIDPTQLANILEVYNEHGIQVHIHVNGDEAIDTAINSIEEVFAKKYHKDHRWTLQHFQLAHEQHFKKAQELGLCVNLFSNHIFYWGDIHANITVGADKANRMDSAALAQRYKVPYSIHSDAPITPLAPLFTAWCAVNRSTASGALLGKEHRVSVDEALRAITLGAAYTLKLDDEIGSIEKGKNADLAILEADPYAINPAELKDIPVWGTMLGGVIFKND